MPIKVITVREKSNDNDVFIHFTTRKGYKRTNILFMIQQISLLKAIK